MKIPVESESVRAGVSERTSAVPGGLSSLQLATMAIAAAVTAASLYYCQPLLSQIARSLHMTARETADIPMVTQVGYAMGLLFFAPLGDMLERRGLALCLLLVVTVSLVATALAPDAWVLLATSLIVGMFSVVPQVMAPMASALSKPEAQGRAIGIVMGGMLIGILLARTVAGFVGTWFGWRAMYAVAAVMMVVLAALLRAMLPVSRPEGRIRYRELLSSLIPLARKLRFGQSSPSAPLILWPHGRVIPGPSGSSGMARRRAARPGDGPQRRPDVVRHGRHLRLLPGNDLWRVEAERFRGARGRGRPTDCRTIR